MILDYINERQVPRAFVLITIAFFAVGLVPYYLGYAFILFLLYKRKKIVDQDYQIGFSPKIGNRTKKYIIVLICVFLSVNTFLALLITIGKSSIEISSPEDIELITQVKLETPPFEDFSPEIYKALYLYDWAKIAKYSVRPLINIVLLPSIIESILVFSLLLSVLLKHISARKSIIIVSVYFALLHIFQAGLIGTFIIALSAPLDAWLYIKSKSLYPTILYHAMWNFTIFFQICFLNLGLFPPIGI
ncbi:MAG: CPBP family intramembrane glutamic endopeptidase [Candidatus Zixiibacteriota bacterium]